MLSYSEIYELLRKEKYSEALLGLPKNFVEDFSDYIAEKKGESESEGDLFMENSMKSKKQLENSIALFKELMRLRKKKLLNLIFVATETGIMKKDYENMLSFERDVFDEVVRAFERGNKEMSKNMNGRKEKKEEGNRMIMFNQEVEQFVGGDGEAVGPFNAGELANLDSKVCEVLVGGGKATFVDED